MGDRTEYFRLYKQAQREKIRGKLCTHCCSSDPERKPRKGNVTCDPCQQAANEAKRSS